MDGPRSGRLPHQLRKLMLDTLIRGHEKQRIFLASRSGASLPPPLHEPEAARAAPLPLAQHPFVFLIPQLQTCP